ncbi:MAG: EscU/YscU/HrcU family type III secretion system export apparatus switch protein [Pararhodobacter sp.]
MKDEDNDDKPHEPTQRKLEKAREKGELPRSADLTATASVAGLLSLALLPGGWLPMRLGDLGRALLEQADPLSRQLLGGGGATGGAIVQALALAVVPALLLPVLAVLVVLTAIRGIVVAPQKLQPKLSRISPLANAKQKFGPTGLFEFAKSTVKLCIYATVLWWFLSAQSDRIIATIGQSPGQATAELIRLLVMFLMIVVVIMAAVGAVDYLWQRFDHLRRQRMSHQELRDEHKEAEGDPHLKQERRARGERIAGNRMMQAVPDADVVIVNPTHYAVALKWDRHKPGAPVCVAKGVDAVALRIRDAAQAAGVPIHHDPPTARALHATVDLGAEIEAAHYAPVAAAIRFAEAMRQRARAQGKGRPAKGPGGGSGTATARGTADR